MLDEQKELLEKLNRLTRYVESRSFFFLPEVDQHLLERQLYAMQTYNHILLQRINRFRLLNNDIVESLPPDHPHTPSAP